LSKVVIGLVWFGSVVDCPAGLEDGAGGPVAVKEAVEVRFGGDQVVAVGNVDPLADRLTVAPSRRRRSVRAW
jgi:hypothetical protein